MPQVGVGLWVSKLFASSYSKSRKGKQQQTCEAGTEPPPPPSTGAQESRLPFHACLFLWAGEEAALSWAHITVLDQFTDHR